jgi:protocatechuate 3,4-dioxygenase beta subunit
MRRHVLIFMACLAVLVAIARDTVAQGFKFLEVKVVDPEGKPLADVPVTIRIDGTEFPMPTNEAGAVSINIPAGDSTELKLAVNQRGYAGLQARWGKGEKIPEKFTIPLTRGTTIGGLVHDQAGKPVAGVKVEALITAFNDYDLGSGNGELRPSIPRELGMTDENGQWEFKAAPGEDAAIQMRFSHPDYVSDSGYSFRGGNWEELRARNKIVIMRKGITITGQVRDLSDKPIAGAEVSIGERFLSNRVEVTTHENGDYSIPNMQEGVVALTVVAKGFAPDLRTIAVSHDMPPADFQLEPGKRIRLKVVNLQGEPLVGVRVIPDEWRGTRNLDRPETLTDQQGYWEWSDAPADEIQYSFYLRGSMGLEKKLLPQDGEQTVEMNPAVVVNGRVIDKETGQPISSFRHVEGVWWEPEYDSYVLQSMNVESGKDGKFRFQMESACHKFCVRVDADGYRPLVSREIFPDEGGIDVTFELEKGEGPKGVVLAPDGTPAAGATVVLGNEEQAAQIYNGELQDFSVTKMTTGVDGEYSLPIVDGDYTLIALHESGWAELKNPNEKAAAEVKLEPWSTVKGTVWQGDQPVSQGQVIIYFDLSPGNSRPHQIWNYSTETDDKGNFTFRRVRHGEAKLYRRLRYANTDNGWMTALSHRQPIQLLPGEVTDVKLGGEGRRVRGKLTAPEKDRDQIDWNFGVVQLSQMENADSRLNTDASYAAPIKSDGTFEIVDVLPDDYSLKVAVYAKGYRTSGLWQPIATSQQPCKVPEESRADAVDLGEITVELVESQD